MKRLLLIAFLFSIIACKKEYSVENQPISIPLPIVATPDITGIWVGEVETPLGIINYCWEITKDSFFAYDRAIIPQSFPTLKGIWNLNGNIFKARSVFDNRKIFNDSAILSNGFKKMIGTEGYDTNNNNWGTFVMNKN